MPFAGVLEFEEVSAGSDTISLHHPWFSTVLLFACHVLGCVVGGLLYAGLGIALLVLVGFAKMSIVVARMQWEGRLRRVGLDREYIRVGGHGQRP